MGSKSADCIEGRGEGERQKMRVIAVVNQKGGSGKTTTTVNLGACLARSGQRVLLMDLDPQAHSTIHLGFKPHELAPTVYDVLTRSEPIEAAAAMTEVDNLWILPSNIELSGAELELAGEVGRERCLRQGLRGLQKDGAPPKYDFVMMDCPPSLGLLTLNALMAANEVIVPIQAEFFALEGMGKLLNTITVVRERLDHEVLIAGVVLTHYDHRKNICRDVDQKVREFFGGKVFETRIRDNVKLAEAPSFGQDVVSYDPSCYGAKDYMALAEEMIALGQG
jgi:chromosome partitioning protein